MSKRIVVAIILIALSGVGGMGSLHAASAGEIPQTAAHAADGSMGPVTACTVAVSCAGATKDGTHDAACASRCLSAASTSRSTMPTLPSLLVGAALLVLAAFELIAPYAGKIRYGTNGIDRILLHQRLASVVLRN